VNDNLLVTGKAKEITIMKKKDHPGEKNENLTSVPN
jgi:hypothetical protein